MVENYGSTDTPSARFTIRSGGTVAISAAFEQTLSLVGGMNTSVGTATEGELTTVESSADAAQKFGEDSELKEQVDLAYANGAGTIYAVPVSETNTTESITGQAQGTLSNSPFDPQIHDEHTIDVQDTQEAASVTVNIVYDAPTQPADANTVNLNPVTGAWYADESSDYDFTYDYGDYTSAITPAVDQDPRIVSVLSEQQSVATSLVSEMNSADVNFDFMHGMVGAEPEADADAYTDSFDDRRLSVVASSRGYVEPNQTNMQRTMGATGGLQAGKELGDSTTRESIIGFTGLHTNYTNLELGSLVDEQVYPLQQTGGEIEVVKDMTTSTDPRFERIYASEIVDEVTEISHQISQSYVGRANTDNNRLALEESHRTSYDEMEENNLLDDFFVAVSEGTTEDEVDVDIGIDVVGVMDVIDVTVTVGDVVTNTGAA